MYRFRHLIQLIFVTITNSNFMGFVTGSIYTGKLKQGCVPGLNCYSCPGALGSCPIGAMQSIETSRLYSIPFYAIGFLMVIGGLIGRFVCGFLCPMGFVQDLLHKIPFSKKVGKLPGDRVLKYLPYVVLLVFVIILPTFFVNAGGVGSPAFCKLICPSGTLMGGWPLAIANEGIRSAIGGLFAWKSFILIGIILLSIVVYRPFCRYLCPLGAIYGLFNPISIFGLRVDNHKCTSCGKCASACKWDIETWKAPNSRECIRCGDCVKACPEKAIKSGIRKSKNAPINCNRSSEKI